MFLLALLTLAGIGLTFAVLVIWLLKTNQIKLPNFIVMIDGVLTRFAAVIAFMVALTASLGSLYFSEFANFAPCVLCWYQRTMMYPLPIVLGTAILSNRHHDARRYGLPLALGGGLIGIYQVSLLYWPDIPKVCGGIGPECTEKYFEYFGFVTIPMMSVVAFALIVMLLVYITPQQKKSFEQMP